LLFWYPKHQYMLQWLLHLCFCYTKLASENWFRTWNQTKYPLQQFRVIFIFLMIRDSEKLSCTNHEGNQWIELHVLTHWATPSITNQNKTCYVYFWQIDEQ
jgi:hypothetical protein